MNDLQKEKLSNAVKSFLIEAIEVIEDTDSPSHSAMVINTLVSEKLLTIAATMGGVVGKEHFNLEERIVYFGNQMVVKVVESLRDDPVFELISKLDEARRK